MSSSIYANLNNNESTELEATLEPDSSVVADLSVILAEPLTFEADSSVTANLVSYIALTATIPGEDLPLTFLEPDAEITADIDVTTVLPPVPNPLPPNPPPNPPANGLAWSKFSFEIPGDDIFASVRGVLETLLAYLEVVKAFLETIKAFLIDFGNPIKALVDALVRLILQLIETLKRTGLYGLFDFPKNLKDPDAWGNRGGYQGFVQRFKGSFLDNKDFNRPRPIPGFLKGGYLLLVVDADGIDQLYRRIRNLLRFLGKFWAYPQYAAPENFKAFPLGATGQDPILSLASYFIEQPTRVVLEWNIPSDMQTDDPGIGDLKTIVGDLAVPPKFLIEKNRVNSPNQELDIDSISQTFSSGAVTGLVETNLAVRGRPGAYVKKKVAFVDEYGEPFVKFQEYVSIDFNSNNNAVALGSFGRFRVFDDDVEPDTDYYYRVRAYDGDLAIDANTKQIPFTAQSLNYKDYNLQQYVITYPTKDGTPATMGKATPILKVRLSKFPPDFNVIQNLKNLFLTAFSLNFHIVLPKGIKFDSNGNPIAPGTVLDIGKGSLSGNASFVSSLVNSPLIPSSVGTFNPLVGQQKPPATVPVDPITGVPALYPWQKFEMIYQASAMANNLASIFLELGSDTITQFQALMQGNPPPAGKVTDVPALEYYDDTLEHMLAEMLALIEVGAPSTSQAGGTVTKKCPSNKSIAIYDQGYVSAGFRKNVLAAVNYVMALTKQGIPPNWIRISILQDIIPWSGQFLYDLLAMIQALLDAFKGLLDEIKDFIDLLIHKINTLEKFIAYLISLLDYVEGLSIGAYMLYVPELDGNLQSWFDAIDNAQGDKPPSGPEGYTAGVALAYLQPDISGIRDAFDTIFLGFG